MKPPAFIPKPAEVGREVLVVILGAIGAALIIGWMPEVKAWINKQWGITPREY